MADSSDATVNGTLAERPLPHLLIYALERKLSGTLELRHESEEVFVVFVEGLVAKIKTSSPVMYLGAVLYEHGAIDQATLGATLAQVSATRRLHGQILLERGAITHDQLVRGLEDLTLRKLAHASAFGPATVFEFHFGLDLLAGYAQAELVLTDPMPAIWAGIRDNPPSEHVASVLSRAEAVRFRLVSGSALARFRLRPDERALAEQLLGEGQGVGTFGSLRIMPRNASELLLYCLLITKHLETVAKAPPSGRSRAPAAHLPPASDVPAPPSARPASAIASAAPPRASSAIPAAPPSRPGLAAVPPGHGVSRPQDRASSPPSSREVAMLERAKTIQKEELFKRLSLSRDATTQQITEAHAALSRMWSTAAAASEGPTREACQTVLAAIDDAHGTLIDPRKRNDYTKGLMHAHGPSAADDLVASGKTNELDGARACFERGDLERAERLARRANHANPQDARALALLTWVEAQRSSNHGVDVTKARTRMLTVAIHLDPDLAEAYFYRALLNKRIGKLGAARADLKKVLELDPSWPDAAHELGECDQAGSTAAPGFLGRLLKR